MNDEGWIAQALAEAEAAGTRGEVPVGAVLVSGEGEMLAADGNRIVERRDPTAHAELLVIRSGAERLGNERRSSQEAQASLQRQADDATRLKLQSQADAAKAHADMAATEVAAAAEVSGLRAR